MASAEEESALDAGQFARDLVGAISDKKGSDIILLDVRQVSLLADHFIICTGETERQIKSIADAILERGKGAGLKPLQTDGSASSGWMVLDYGTLIVHLFLPMQRDYYRIEDLWSDAALVVSIQ